MNYEQTLNGPSLNEGIIPLKLRKNIDLSDLRKKALANNINSDYSKNILESLICPLCRVPLKVSEKHLQCQNGHKAPIENGVPDFTIFNKNAVQEKTLQANFLNETFDEIVFRPYNSNAVHLESWIYHLRQCKKLLFSKLGVDLKNITILNCGCGGGFEAEYFAKNGASVLGFDISQVRVEAAATRFEFKNLNGFFYRGDAATIPFNDNSFDLVLYHDSLHHVPIEEIPVAIREASRVAKLGVVLLEAHDSPLRMFLESIGLSTSVEESGNYVFRFRKSLMEFFGDNNSMKLVNYSVSFTKKEHFPGVYSIPIIGWAIYRIIRFFGIFLRPLGNEACIIFKKNSS